MSIAFTLCVCMFVCLQSKGKTGKAINTKLYLALVTGNPKTANYFQGQRSRTQGQNSQISTLCSIDFIIKAGLAKFLQQVDLGLGHLMGM